MCLTKPLPGPRPPARPQLHPNAARKKKSSLKTASEEEDAALREQANALQRQAYQQGEWLGVAGSRGCISWDRWRGFRGV